MTFRALIALIAAFVLWIAVAQVGAPIDNPGPDTKPSDAAASKPAGAGSTKPNGATPLAPERKRERAIAAALRWIARHQSPDGSWGFARCMDRCKDQSCGKAEVADSPAVATSLALLTFIGAGQTHLTKGPYKSTLQAGLDALLAMQLPSGAIVDEKPDLMRQAVPIVFLSGLYALSGDETARDAAQKAIDFVQSSKFAPRKWEYRPGQQDNATATIWAWLAVNSALRARLKVDPAARDALLNELLIGTDGMKTIDSAPSYSLILRSARLSALQAKEGRGSSLVKRQFELLEGHALAGDAQDPFAAFVASQSLADYSRERWPAARAALDKTLIENQTKKDCAAGSWSPAAPTAGALAGEATDADGAGQLVGRLYSTGL